MQSKTTRRTFVKGLAAAGILGGMGMWRTPVWAVNSPGQPNVLTGNEFDLFIGETPVNRPVPTASASERLRRPTSRAALPESPPAYRVVAGASYQMSLREENHRLKGS